ncbi:neuroblast differentiation-associated protein AHNAK-like [Anguilla anguilla]|uniref:neuroblast differentiation-associated protein AHNAK-like n=1 Tax=Anguilla anguilla TaxID=7936 RepID=UPI0015AF4801|nr:neuroblast differentiation-associated protein AHNAK-like [Anguilla anguilla]
MSLPKFGFSKPEITAPKISGNLNLPSVDIAVTKPDADINVPDLSADVTSVGVKLPEADLAVSGKPPAVDIKGYSMDVEAPEVDIDMKVKGTELEGQGSKFKLPKFGISLPKGKAPAMDITLSKPDVDISLPQVTAEAKLPGVEVEGPSVEGTVDIPEVDSKGVDIKLKKPKMSFPKFGFSKQDATAPEIDISLPKGDISLAGGSIEVKEPGMDIKAPDVGEKDSGIKGSPSKFKVPTFKLPKFGITAPKVKAEAPDLSVNVTVPDTETPSGKAIIDHEGTVMETGKTEGKFELPKMKIPNIDVKVPTLKGQDMSQEIPKAEYEISGPDTVKVDLKGSSLDGQAKIPDIEAGAGDQGRFKMPHIKFPSFGFSKPEITAPKISGNLNLPSVDIAVTKPDADINVSDISADVTSVGVKLPEADQAVSGKPPAVDMKDYSMDVQAPDVDIGTEGKSIELEGQGSRFKLPKFGITFQKAKGPAVDVSVSKPDVDISLPQVTAEAKLPGVEVEGPSVEATVDMPALDSKEVDVKLKKPKISLPKFGFSKPDIKAPEIDVSLPKQDICLAEGSMEVKGPEVDIKAADTSTEIKDKNMDIVGSPTKFKLPTIKFPKFGISAPKVTTESPDIKTDIKLPEMEASEKAKVDIGAPSVDIDGSSVELNKPKGQFEPSKIKMPDIDVSLPKGKDYIKTPDIDINLPEVDMSLPECKVDVKGSDVAIKTQDTEANVDAHIGGSPSKFKLPTFKMPKFGMTGSKVKTEIPEVTAESTEPALSGKVNVKHDGQGMDIEKPEGKFELPKVKMPDISFSLPKTKGIEINQEIPKPESNISVPETDTVLKEPKLELKGMHIDGQAEIPGIEAGVEELGKFKMPHIKMPSFGFSRPETTGSKISGDVHLPSVDIAITKPDTEINVPHISAGVTSVGGKHPEPELTMSGETPAANIKDYSVAVEGPEVDIDMKAKDTELEGQGSKFKLPKFGISFPKTKGPAVDISVSKPEVDISLPEVPAEAKLPGVEVEGPSVEGTVDIPEVDSKGVDAKVKKPKISFSKFGFSKPEVQAPEPEVSLPEESLVVKGPEVDIKAPETQIEIKDKNKDIISSPTKFKLPTIKFPKFGVSGPKVLAEPSNAKTDITVPEFETSSGQLKVDIGATGFDMEKSSVDLDKTKGKTEIEIQGIDVSDIKAAEPEGQGSRFKLPKLGISFQKVKGPGVDISESKAEVDISSPGVTVEAQLPSVELEGPSIEGRVDVPEVESKEVDLKLKKPRISFPKFGFSKPDIKAPEIDVNLPKGDISLTEGSVEVKGPEVNIKAPDTQTELKDKNMDIIGSPTKFKLPTFKFPTFSVVAPKSKVEAQEVSADITVPEIKAPLVKAEVDVGAPVLETDILSIEIEKSEGTGKLPKLKMTSIDMSLPKGQGSESKPEDEMSAVRTEGKIDVSELEATGTALEAKVDISDPEPPKPEVDIRGSPSKFKLPTFKMPKFGFSSAKVKTKDTDIDTGLKTPEVPFKGATKEIQESIDDGTSNITETDKKTGDAEGQTKSSKFSLSNVFRGFDLEFHVPTLEEVEETLVSPREDVAHSGEIEQSTHTSAEKDSTIKYQSHTDPSQTQLSTSHGAEVSVQAPTITKEAEAKEQSKFKFRFPRLGFTESSEQGDKTESINMNVEEKEKSLEPQEEKEKEDMNEKEANTDKGTWFKFPKFGITSPSKTIKVPEKGTSQPTEGTDKNMEGDIEEGDVSLTSVRSSDAFADISSTVTSEQPGPLVVSPTKVKVKISEPTAIVGVSEVKVPTDIITSTARTELILLEPHLPGQVDTVTIPVSSEATLTSPDEKTQETEGDIHVVTSNIQATPSSEHAKVITKYETHSVQALSLQKMTVKVGSASWTVEESGEWPGESSEENILVEKHMVKEKSGDDKEAVIITQRVRQIVGASSGEPILEDTASAIKKLRDTMHSEKMKFFEDAETSTVTVSTHKIEKHGFETSTEKK